MTTLLTMGTFDVPHVGHAAFLRKCESFADEVIVGVNTDEFVASYKKHPPLYRTSERLALIAELGYPVVRNTSPGRELIEQVEPDVLAIGSDWARKDYYAQIDVDQDFLDSLGVAVVYIPYTSGISSSAIKDRVARQGMFRVDDSDALNRGALIAHPPSMSND